MPTITAQTLTTRNDIKPEIRIRMIELLNHQLADTFDLFSQTKQAHWNVRGSDFIQLHKLYDDIAEELIKYVDLIAERINSLGGISKGTVRMAAASTRLPEISDSLLVEMESVESLVERFANLAESTRRGIDQSQVAGDTITSDLLTEVGRGLDKALWFIEAHLPIEG